MPPVRAQYSAAVVERKLEKRTTAQREKDDSDCYPLRILSMAASRVVLLL